MVSQSSQSRLATFQPEKRFSAPLGSSSTPASSGKCQSHLRWPFLLPAAVSWHDSKNQRSPRSAPNAASSTAGENKTHTFQHFHDGSAGAKLYSEPLALTLLFPSAARLLVPGGDGGSAYMERMVILAWVLCGSNDVWAGEEGGAGLGFGLGFVAMNQSQDQIFFFLDAIPHRGFELL